MLIGAEARDILHRELGHEFATQATQDVDLAFVIPDWFAYDRLVEGLEAIADSGIAFRVAGTHVDFMAFGPIESPPGIVRPPFRTYDPLDVFGMSEVYASARPASVGDGLEIRIPTVAGYVALKLKAWIDRSADHNLKDAPDLGLALFWASESTAFANRFWGDHELVGTWQADAGLAGAALLGGDVRDALGPVAADHLAALFVEESRNLLAQALQSVSHDFGLGDVARRHALLTAMTTALGGA